VRAWLRGSGRRYLLEFFLGGGGVRIRRGLRRIAMNFGG
jgi:hypothetical protein